MNTNFETKFGCGKADGILKNLSLPSKYIKLNQ